MQVLRMLKSNAFTVTHTDLHYSLSKNLAYIDNLRYLFAHDTSKCNKFATPLYYLINAFIAYVENFYKLLLRVSKN